MVLKTVEWFLNQYHALVLCHRKIHKTKRCYNFYFFFNVKFSLNILLKLSKGAVVRNGHRHGNREHLNGRHRIKKN